MSGPTHLWWLLMRLGVLCFAPLALVIGQAASSKLIGWNPTEGVGLLICGLLVLLAPILIVVGMWPARRPASGQELPEELALRFRRISGVISGAVMFFGMGVLWCMVCRLFGIAVPAVIIRVIGFGHLVLFLGWCFHDYFSRCPQCCAFAISVRPIYPEGTICRCRRCSAFSSWRS